MGGLPVPRVDQLVSQRVAVLSDVQVMSTHDSCLVNKNHSPDELSNQQLIVFIVSTSSVDDKLLKYTDVLTNIKASTSKKVSMYLEKRRFFCQWRIDVLFITPRCGCCFHSGRCARSRNVVRRGHHWRNAIVARLQN
jgi:hypothetical protein